MYKLFMFLQHLVFSCLQQRTAPQPQVANNSSTKCLPGNMNRSCLTEHSHYQIHIASSLNGTATFMVHQYHQLLLKSFLPVCSSHRIILWVHQTLLLCPLLIDIVKSSYCQACICCIIVGLLKSTFNVIYICSIWVSSYLSCVYSTHSLKRKWY